MQMVVARRRFTLHQLAAHNNIACFLWIQRSSNHPFWYAPDSFLRSASIRAYTHPLFLTIPNHRTPHMHHRSMRTRRYRNQPPDRPTPLQVCGWLDPPPESPNPRLNHTIHLPPQVKFPSGSFVKYSGGALYKLRTRDKNHPPCNNKKAISADWHK